MTIIQLNEVTEKDVKSEYVEKVKNDPEFEEFSELFNTVSDRSVSELDSKVYKREGDESPCMLVFKSNEDKGYKLTARFTDDEYTNKEVYFSLEVSEREV